jgi:hypothetical protein
VRFRQVRPELKQVHGRQTTADTVVEIKNENAVTGVSDYPEPPSSNQAERPLVIFRINISYTSVSGQCRFVF